MHAKYVSNTTSVQAQVIADLAALLSGASIASLSASCDKVNTTLVSTVAPGWTLIDSAAPSSGYVITAPDADGLTTKIANIFSSTAVMIGLSGYETWNATTHAGTNLATAVQLKYSSTSINTYFVFATPRSFYIHIPSLLNSSGSTVGSTDSGVGLFEFSRDCEYLKGSTYSCFMIVNAAALACTQSVTPVASGVPRMKNLTAAGDVTGTASGVSLASLGYKHMASSNSASSYFPIRPPTNTLLDAAGVPYFELRAQWAMQGISGNSAGIAQAGPLLGKVYDLLELSGNVVNSMDTISDGTSTYTVAIVNNTNNNTVVQFANGYAFKVA